MYSNAVKIGGLNDYLNPSEECVLPLLKNVQKYEIKLNDKSSGLKDNNLPTNSAKADIYSVNKLKVTSVNKNNKISVGLSDCLSCSGCLTSSEEILLKDDNYLKIVGKLKQSNVSVVSISPQTIFMFSSYYNTTPYDALLRLSYLFRLLGAKFVFDIGLAELLSLAKSKDEFISNYRSNNSTKAPNGLSSTENLNDTKNNNHTTNDRSHSVSFPIISSHCPGLTLYAEKTLDQHLVDTISKVPSSQIIQGLLVKILCYTINYYRQIYYLNYFKLFFSFIITSFLSTNQYRNYLQNTCTLINNIKLNTKDSKDNLNRNGPKVYHVSIVPCYDKKFEMIRSEYNINFKSFFSAADDGLPSDEKGEDSENEPIVDDILSTSDVQKILDHLNIEFNDLKRRKINYLFDYTYYFNKFTELSLYGSKDNEMLNCLKDRLNGYEKGGLRRLIRSSTLYCHSGGFSEEIFKYASNQIFNRSFDNVQFKRTINSDFKECVLYGSDNKVLLRFIIAYGFKNIKNVIKMLKSTKSIDNDVCEDQIDYIELMSCPGGCFNGAGQMIDKEEGKSNKDIFKNLSKMYTLKRFLNYFKSSDRRDINTISSNSFDKFLKETTYINTEEPICQYFNNILNLIPIRYDLKSHLKNGRNVDIKW